MQQWLTMIMLVSACLTTNAAHIARNPKSKITKILKAKRLSPHKETCHEKCVKENGNEYPNVTWTCRTREDGVEECVGCLVGYTGVVKIENCDIPPETNTTTTKDTGDETPTTKDTGEETSTNTDVGEENLATKNCVEETPASKDSGEETPDAINELRKMNVDQAKTIARIKKVNAEQTKAIGQIKKEIKDLRTYQPNGPQVNVPLETITKGGWRVCYRGSYAEVLTDSAVQNIADTMCRGSRIMMGCGKEEESNVPSTMQLIAWGPRKTVFTHTSDVGVVSMGTRFYRTGTTWGFNGGSTSNRSSSIKKWNYCGTDKEEGEKRLCWHTDVGNGWRCGQNEKLSGHVEWKRVIFESD